VAKRQAVLIILCCFVLSCSLFPNFSAGSFAKRAMSKVLEVRHVVESMAIEVGIYNPNPYKPGDKVTVHQPVAGEYGIVWEEEGTVMGIYGDNVTVRLASTGKTLTCSWSNVGP